MSGYKVTHTKFGNGIVTDINEGYVTVSFAAEEKKFMLKGFDRFFQYDDPELMDMVSEANCPPSQTQQYSASTEKKDTSIRDYHPYTAIDRESSNVLLGPRAQTIAVYNQHQMFEIVGYIATPGRVKSFEAEVPVDGRDRFFEKMFPNQVYRPIQMGDTPSGMPNKLSPQFRINFSNTRNCPELLKKNLGAGNGGCVARLNKSKFVLLLVENYGFRFGESQNLAEIREIAAKKGFLEDFERGFGL